MIAEVSIDWAKFLPALATATWETIYMVLIALVAGGTLGLILGILLYSVREGGVLQNRVVFNILNVVIGIFRPIPFIIFLALLGPLTKLVVHTQLGNPAVTFALSIASSFAVARIVEQNLVSIDPGVIEAARAMGASPLRIISTLLVPEALGQLILGYTFMFITIADASAVAGIVGGGGLGNFAIVSGYNRYNYAVTVITVLVIVIIVQGVQIVGNILARRALRR